MNLHVPLGAREVYQLLKDVAQGERSLSVQPNTGADPQTLLIDIDGWQLCLLTDGDALQRCGHCRAPDGREGSLDDWHRSGTDPLAFLSVWELRQIERALKNA